MYYLTDTHDRYYAGQCYSDERIPVFKDCYNRALYFGSMKEAIDYCTRFNLQYLNIKFIKED